MEADSGLGLVDLVLSVGYSMLLLAFLIVSYAWLIRAKLRK